MEKCKLLLNTEKLHTTKLGADRIKRNLSLDIDDIVDWCKQKIQKNNSVVTQNGKNYYVSVDSCEITINRHSFTIITAHKLKNKKNCIKIKKRTKKDIILKFIQSINEQSVPTIIEMMSEDFYFIDTYGDKEHKEQMKTGWQGYFDWFPDYLIEVHDYVETDDFSIIIGKASASYQGKKDRYWEFPACWKVIVREEQIQLWQVFCDSKKQLDSMV